MFTSKNLMINYLTQEVWKCRSTNYFTFISEITISKEQNKLKIV